MWTFCYLIYLQLFIRAAQSLLVLLPSSINHPIHIVKDLAVMSYGAAVDVLQKSVYSDHPGYAIPSKLVSKSLEQKVCDHFCGTGKNNNINESPTLPPPIDYIQNVYTIPEVVQIISPTKKGSKLRMEMMREMSKNGHVPPNVTIRRLQKLMQKHANGINLDNDVWPVTKTIGSGRVCRGI